MCEAKLYIPNILYKYLDFEGGKAMLEKHSLKYCPINELNDPFEFMPGGYDMTYQSLARQADIVFQQNKEKYLDEIMCRLGRKLTDEELELEMERFHSYIVKSIYDGMQNRDWQSFINNASAKYGVLSLCEEATNILMWSHYADEHKGIVIGIDSSVLRNPQKVWYNSCRPKLKASFDSNEDEYKNAVLNIMTTKALEWQYEHEWRCIEKLDRLDKVDCDAKTLYLDMTLTLDNIKEIFFGARMSEDSKELIKKMFSSTYPVFYNLSYNNTKYSLDCKKCE